MTCFDLSKVIHSQGHRLVTSVHINAIFGTWGFLLLVVLNSNLMSI